MKELIKPNKKEVEYGNVEALCERGDGYYVTYSAYGYTTTGYSCINVEISSDSENSDDILF